MVNINSINKIGLYVLLLIVNLYFNNVISEVASSSKTVPFLIITVPKCGTHLLQKCIKMLVGQQPAYVNEVDIGKNLYEIIKNKHILISHLPYSYTYEKLLTEQNVPVFFMIRDPRDQSVSRAHYFKKNVHIWKWVNNLTVEDLLYHDLGPGHCSINTYFTKFLSWINYKNIYIVRFEDLVGPAGGGFKKNQIDIVKNIAKHINVRITDKLAEDIGSSLFGGTSTFRQGKIGAWKTDFTKEHKKAFKEVAGQLLIDLGYEKDLNW